MERRGGKNGRTRRGHSGGKGQPVDDDAGDVAYCEDDDYGDGDDDDDDNDNHKNTGMVSSACYDYRIPKRTRR